MLLGKIRGIFEYKIEEGNSNIAVAVMDRLNGTYINSPVNKIYKKSIIIDNNIYIIIHSLLN